MAKQKKVRNKNNFAMWVMVSPYLFLLVAFGLIPIIMAILEVPHESRVNPDGGWDAFAIVLQDFRFLPAVRNVLGFMAIFVPTTIIFVIVMSLMLDLNPTKWKKWLRMAYIVPAAISGAVAVLVWYALLQPAFSPIKEPLSWFGIVTSDQIWQTEKLVYIFAAMAFFAIAGNWILIQFGSLQSISGEVIEAARVDGCSALQIALKIKLPLIKKYIVYMGVLIFAGGLQIFVEPQLIDSGIYSGIAESWSLDQLAFELAFTTGDFGGASALSLMLLVPSFLGALVVIFKTDMFEEAVIDEKKKVEA
jgi:multiple sugar transport system permease protein